VKIPRLLNGLLHKDGDSAHGAVLKSVGDFEEWLADRKLVFFPEYTDHGITHVESVLRGAEWLLADKARKALKPADAAVLVLAVLLHDCAMHLSKQGFLRLVKRESAWPPKHAKFLDKMNGAAWPDLWEGFLREAKRWDGQKREDLFGTSREIRRPPDEGPWDEDDNLLIGEFLRRHHPRLAHEIAICGVPGPDEDSLAFTGVDDRLADLAGLVARSHGMDLRSVVELLDRRDRPDTQGVHLPLLMSLIRIADYLEIDASRAPTALLKVRSLRSRISQREWEKHAAVPHMKVDPEDPEAVWIDAEPKDLETFVGLQDLFAGVQREVDASWSVLGEVYRGDPRFALRIRRIRSTLDDREAFAAGASFVPERARFDSAGGDLLKVLVGPLYDNEPAYGIRELIQNGVDACRELEDLLDRQPDLHLDRAGLDGDVVVTVEEEQDGAGWITVADRGIGMNADAIVNYYLKAGASLRHSEEWHERHVGRDGRPRLSRSGRFGVGVLATFLLGDEVEVTTRHMHAPRNRGIQFTARLDQPRIELRWCERDVGTTIRVRVTSTRVFDSLARTENWDWYRLRRPVVVRRVQLQKERIRGSALPAGQKVTLPDGEIVPHGDNPLPAPWRRLRHSASGEILWSLQRETGWADVANGIVLKRPDVLSIAWPILWPDSLGESIWEQRRSRPEYFLFRPRLAVMEGTALLPVDLRRTAPLSPLFFNDDLIRALCRDVLGSLLVRAADNRRDLLRQIASLVLSADPRTFMTLETLWHPAISTDRDQHGTKIPGGTRVSSWLFATERGLTLEDPALDAEQARHGVAFVVVDCDSDVSNDDILDRALRRIPPGVPVGAQVAVGHRAEVDDRCRSGGYASAVIVSPTRRWDAVKGIPGFMAFQQLDAGNGWTIAWTGDDPMRRLDLDQLGREPALEEDLAHLLLFLPAGHKPEQPRNPLSSLWRELLYHGEIPCDRTLRKQVFARAYDELREEIDLWQQLAMAEPADRQARARYWIDSRRTQSVDPSPAGV
jgi:hypothetical protein